VNLSTTEFPLYATVEPHAVDSFTNEEDDNNGDPSGKASSPSQRRGRNGASEDEEDNDEENNGQEWTHFGGGSNYNMNSNSTILDAEIL